MELKPLRRFLRRAVLAAAAAWRRCLRRTTFIGVTGSVGKTTTKELLAAILATRHPTIRNRGNSNHYGGVSKTILRTRPWHRYAVVEVGIVAPGQMGELAGVLNPEIAVWVSVARTHVMNFGTLENTAREKSQLVESLAEGGVAVMNDDNPWIAAYRPPPGIRTVYCGSTARSAVSARNVTSRWPGRLTLDVVAGSESARISTRLVGEHWVGSILAAVATAIECGYSLEDCATALAQYEPMPSRLSPVELPNGATILRDELNGSVDTLDAALLVMENATARRRVLVFTDVSDSPRKPRRRVRAVGARAARVAEAAVFIGEQCERGAAGAIEAGMPAENVRAFHNIRDAAAHLKEDVRDGDLVLIRGRRCDHLARVYLSMVRDVTCWRNRCTKRVRCEECSRLARPVYQR